MASSRTVSVALVADIGQYQTAMAKAAATTKTVGTTAETSGAQAQRGFDLAGKGALILGGAAVAAGVGLKSAIGAASDLNETLNKSNVIFGDSAGQIERWAQGSAKNFGLSKQAALEAASSFGNMLQQLGFSGDAAVEASTGVVKLAADLGSFNNLQTGDVLDRIGAAMRGEYDSLQLLIPNINAARVEQEAMAMTGKANKDALTAQEKAAATLAIVQRDGAAAANDFAETSDGLANSTKIAEAQFEDLKAEIGQAFLPVAQGAMGFISDTAIPAFSALFNTIGSLIGAFADLPGPVLAGIGVLTALMLINGPLAGAIGRSTLALASWYGQAVAASGATGILGAAMVGARGAAMGLVGLMGGPLGLAITGVTVGLGFLVSWLSKGDDATSGLASSQKTLRDALAATNGVIDDSVRVAAAKALQDQHLLDFTELYGVSSQDMVGYVLGEADAHDRVSAALDNYRDKLEAKLTGDKDADLIIQGAIDAVDGHKAALDGLATGTDTQIAKERQLAEATGQTGGAMAASTAQTEEATKALEKWIGQLQQVGAGFVEPLGVYKDLLNEKSQAEREAAEKTAAATESSKDSWEDYVDEASVSLDEWAAKLEEQILAQENWRSNLVLISQRGGVEVAQILSQMGVEGAGVVQQMVDATDEDFGRMRDLMIRDAQLGGSGAALALDTQMKVMAAIAASGGKATAAGIAQELGIGVGEVARIASQYANTLGNGVNPLLVALGKPTIAMTGNFVARPGVNVRNADGNLYEEHQAEIAPGGAWRVWAEPETGGEAYIPLAPSKRGRSVDIWRETGRRLGIDVQEFAFGGISDVPRPPSTAPYRDAVGLPGDATMGRAYDDTRAWVAANTEPPQSSGGSSTGLLPIMAAARQYVMDTYGIRNIGGFARRNIIGTRTLSDHGLGKAIDIMTTNLKLGWTIANDFAFGPAHDRFRAENVIWQQSISSNGGRFVGMADRGSPTQNHRDHVHVDTYDTGGILGHGQFGLNLSGQPERVLNPRETVAYEAGLRSREFSGGGRWGGGGSVNVAPPVVKVYLDGQEWRGMARVEAEGVVVDALTGATSRGNYNG